MYRHDYILRLIEQLSRALITLYNRLLYRQIEAADARVEIDRIARDAGLDLNVARHLDERILLAWLVPTGDVDEAKLWLVAELLYLDALAAREADETAGEPGVRKALAVFSRLPPNSRPADGLASAGERVVELQRLITSP